MSPSSDRTRAAFEQLVARIVRHPERRAELEEELFRIFSRRAAILVLDMCGFSRTTRSHGIVAFLVLIHEMQELCRPVAAAHRGILVKVEADNLVFLFDHVDDALLAAQEIQTACTEANRNRPSDRALQASIGIGYGDTLYIGNEDVHGDEMNLASKLGEDIAGPGEILLTQSAVNGLAAGPLKITPASVSISGMKLDYFRVND
jgi:class 3 adenylate cyclase